MADGRFVSIRKLAAFDLYFRGSRPVLLEFGSAVFGLGGLGVLAVFFTPMRSLLAAVIGSYLIALAAGYLPLLVYALALVRTRNPRGVVEAELAEPRRHRRKYGVQHALVLIPLAVPLLAVSQEMSARPSRSAVSRVAA